MNNKEQASRRKFIKGLSAAIVLPYIIPSSVFATSCNIAPSDKINLGFIGTGEHAISRNMKGFLPYNDCHIGAICDVDTMQIDKAKKYLLETGGEEYKNVPVYSDFREVINRSDLDAVVISTPDHWHVYIGIAAAREGKDVFVEKPLTVSINDGKKFCQVMEETGRIVQVASEQRCRPEFHQMAEIIRNGGIGKLKHIEVGMPSGHPIHENPNDKRPQLEICQPPKGFDFKMWTGPSPEAPYRPGRIHWNWRWIEDLAEGQFNDYAHHLIDIAQWAHGTEDTLPISVEGKGIFPEGFYNTATDYDCNYTFADGVTMNCKSGKTGHRFEGTDGIITNTGWGKLSSEPASLLDFKPGSGKVKLYTAENEHRNFLDCVKSRNKCYSPEGLGHRSAAIAHMGYIAMKLKRKLQFDPVKEVFVNDAEANKMLSKPVQSQWKIV